MAEKKLTAKGKAGAGSKPVSKSKAEKQSRIQDPSTYAKASEDKKSKTKAKAEIKTGSKVQDPKSKTKAKSKTAAKAKPEAKKQSKIQDPKSKTKAKPEAPIETGFAHRATKGEAPKSRKAKTTAKAQPKATAKPKAKSKTAAEPQIEVLPAGDEEIEETVKALPEPSRDSSSSRAAIYDPVSAYYQTVRHYPILTREEEKSLALAFLEDGEVDAAYELVTSNLRLVIKIALEYRRLWREIVDLIQEGNVGLMHAVKKYDPYRGVRFSSYAAWWIRAYIIRYIMNNTRMVKIGTTQAQRTLYFQLGKERERLRKMGIEPDSKAIAKSLKVKESEVEEMSMRLSSGDLSLEAKRGEDGDFTLMDTIPALEPDTERRVADAEARSIYLEKLSTFVDSLADRDRKIFTMRWMRDDPMTLQVVGEELGITRERVRQLEARIIKNLRVFLEEEGLSASDFFE